MGGGDLSADEYRALAEFRYEIRRFLHFSEEAARAAGLNPQHHQLLLVIKGAPETLRPTVHDAAERLHIRHHSAVELTNRLVVRGLIRKRRDRFDRRRVLLEVTARGDATLRNLSLIHREQLEDVGRKLIRALQKLLKRNGQIQEINRSGKDHLKRNR